MQGVWGVRGYIGEGEKILICVQDGSLDDSVVVGKRCSAERFDPQIRLFVGYSFLRQTEPIQARSNICIFGQGQHTEKEPFYPDQSGSVPAGVSGGLTDKWYTYTDFSGMHVGDLVNVISAEQKNGFFTENGKRGYGFFQEGIDRQRKIRDTYVTCFGRYPIQSATHTGIRRAKKISYTYLSFKQEIQLPVER
ncbi:hypothetical protein [Methanoregula sp.]|uniref:hypothetical protein n=1 Tax=Methanoregula sp. TaxID=2052170 RepID=UPI003561624A